MFKQAPLVSKIALVAVSSALLLTGCSSAENGKATNTATQSQTAQSQADKSQATKTTAKKQHTSFAVSFAEYTKQLAQVAKKEEYAQKTFYQILPSDNGEKVFFSQMFDDVSTFGSIDKNDKLAQVFYHAAKLTAQNSTTLTFATADALQALNPQLDKKQTTEKVINLVAQATVDYASQKQTVVHLADFDGVELGVYFVEEQGLFTSISKSTK